MENEEKQKKRQKKAVGTIRYDVSPTWASSNRQSNKNQAAFPPIEPFRFTDKLPRLHVKPEPGLLRWHRRWCSESPLGIDRLQRGVWESHRSLRPRIPSAATAPITACYVPLSVDFRRHSTTAYLLIRVCDGSSGCDMQCSVHTRWGEQLNLLLVRSCCVEKTSAYCTHHHTPYEQLNKWARKLRPSFVSRTGERRAAPYGSPRQ